MNKNKKFPLSSRRGITITEVVISLVIIGIISSAALSLVLYSINVEKESFSVVEAKNAAENGLACFRYAENESEFIEALSKTGEYILQEDGYCLLEGDGYEVRIKANYLENFFEYNAVRANGEEIFSFRYPKTAQGGGA